MKQRLEKHTIWLLFLCCVVVYCTPKLAQPATQPLFTTHDFTAENLFSRNIEGPLFVKNGSLYVVNFQTDGTIGKVGADGSPELFATLPEGSIANSIQMNSRGQFLLADFPKHNVLLLDTATKAVSIFCHNAAFNQPNDLTINRRDQLFASDPNWKESTGQLWRIDADGTAHLLEKNMGTTNGITLSPDETTLYVNESVQRRVWAYDVTAEGDVLNKRLFAQFTDYGLDGMKCDRAGNLYVTRYGKGTVALFSPSGSLLREVTLKGKNCSNLAFGGPDGKTVFVTMQDRKGIEYFRTDIAGKGF